MCLKQLEKVLVGGQQPDEKKYGEKPPRPVLSAPRDEPDQQDENSERDESNAIEERRSSGCLDLRRLQLPWTVEDNVKKPDEKRAVDQVLKKKHVFRHGPSPLPTTNAHTAIHQATGPDVNATGQASKRQTQRESSTRLIGQQAPNKKPPEHEPGRFAYEH